MREIQRPTLAGQAIHFAHRADGDFDMGLRVRVENLVVLKPTDLLLVKYIKTKVGGATLI